MQQLRSAIHNAIARFLKNQPPARIIAVGFALLILLGAALLMLPFAVHPGAHVGPLDALFTATSAVCVTGLVVVDTGDTFSLFGQLVIAVLMVYALISLFVVHRQTRQLQDRAATLQQQVSEMTQANAELQYQIDHSDDDDMRESVAREKLGLVKPGEKIFYDTSD